MEEEIVRFGGGLMWLMVLDCGCERSEGFGWLRGCEMDCLLVFAALSSLAVFGRVGRWVGVGR